MSDDPKQDLPNEDLDRQVAEIESEEWLTTLKELKPTAGVDLYAIGFAVGKQFAQSENTFAKPIQASTWLHARTALLSSAITVAATLLLLTTFSRSNERESEAPVITSVDTPSHQQAALEIADEQSFQLTIPQSDDLLAGLPSAWRERIDGNSPKLLISDNADLVAEVDPSRLVYSFQRRQLIESLRGNIQ